MDLVLQNAVVPGIDINSLDKKPVTHSSRAATAGKLNLVRVLLCLAGAGVDAKDENPASLLFRAAEGGCIEGVRVLLQHGAIIDELDNEKTPVIEANESRHEGLPRSLPKGGVRLDAP